MRRLMAGGLILVGLGLSGCVSPRAADRGGTCDAARAQRFVGNAAGDDLPEDARAAAGARTVRTITPGQMVTMDYRADRLNVTIDESGHVAAMRCG